MATEDQQFIKALDLFIEENNDSKDDGNLFIFRNFNDQYFMFSNEFINSNFKSLISSKINDPLDNPNLLFQNSNAFDFTKREDMLISSKIKDEQGYMINEMNKDKKNIDDEEISPSNKSEILLRSFSIKKKDQKSSKLTHNKKAARLMKLISGTGQNIAKNFIKAISSFCISDLAWPYLDSMFNNSTSTHEKFKEFICTKKETVESLKGLISMTIPYDDDTEEETFFKSLIKKLSIIFLKYFAVNWIYGSTKLRHRNILMKNRFIIMKKIQHPEINMKIIRPNCKSSKKC